MFDCRCRKFCCFRPLFCKKKKKRSCNLITQTAPPRSKRRHIKSEVVSKVGCIFLLKKRRKETGVRTGKGKKEKNRMINIRNKSLCLQFKQNV